MASSAGFQLVAGRIPGERIATTIATSDTGTFTTTETTIDSVTAALVDGRTYKLRWFGGIASTVADSVVLVRIREDSLTGTILQERNHDVSTTTTPGMGVGTETEFTAVATANKVFVVTAVRNGGTGTLHGDASSTRTRYLYVDYISG